MGDRPCRRPASRAARSTPGRCRPWARRSTRRSTSGPERAGPGGRLRLASSRARRSYEAHARLLQAWGAAINLTAIREPAEVARRHVCDALSAVPRLVLDALLTGRPAAGPRQRRRLPGSAAGRRPAARTRRAPRVRRQEGPLPVRGRRGRAGRAGRGAPPGTTAEAHGAHGGSASTAAAQPSPSSPSVPRTSPRRPTSVPPGTSSRPARWARWPRSWSSPCPWRARAAWCVAWKREEEGGGLRSELREAGSIIRAAGGGRPEVEVVPASLLAGPPARHRAERSGPRPPPTRADGRPPSPALSAGTPGLGRRSGPAAPGDARRSGPATLASDARGRALRHPFQRARPRGRPRGRRSGRPDLGPRRHRRLRRRSPTRSCRASARADAIAVQGNHDAAVLGRIAVDTFNELASAAVAWTAAAAAPATLAWLAEPPERRVEDAFTLVHGSPRDPLWEYLICVPAARRNLAAFETRLLPRRPYPPAHELPRRGRSDRGARPRRTGPGCASTSGAASSTRAASGNRATAIRVPAPCSSTSRRARSSGAASTYPVGSTQQDMHRTRLPRPLADRLAVGR